eukprot:m.199087 g.199087  ORF g.199087 m.199087 type:complete len:305 (-) comp10655_c1_seq4:618-1532(-)
MVRCRRLRERAREEGRTQAAWVEAGCGGLIRILLLCALRVHRMCVCMGVCVGMCMYGAGWMCSTQRVHRLLWQRQCRPSSPPHSAPLRRARSTQRSSPLPHSASRSLSPQHSSLTFSTQTPASQTTPAIRHGAPMTSRLPAQWIRGKRVQCAVWHPLRCLRRQRASRHPRRRCGRSRRRHRATTTTTKMTMTWIIATALSAKTERRPAMPMAAVAVRPTSAKTTHQTAAQRLCADRGQSRRRHSPATPPGANRTQFAAPQELGRQAAARPCGKRRLPNLRLTMRLRRPWRSRAPKLSQKSWTRT